MTIPIEPGPFSFLTGIGQALGAYGQQKEVNRQEQLKEAKDQAHNYIALRLAGLMKPKDFDTPEVQAVFHMAGFGPVTSDETPDELIRGMKGSYLQGLINPSAAQPVSDEQRALIGAPERGLSEGINAKMAGYTTAEPKARAEIAQAGAAVPQAQLAGTTAEAQLPGAGLTAQAGQLGAQDKTFNDIADRYIEGLYATTKKLPKNGAEALKQAAADPKIGPVASQIGQSYFDQAIERLRAKIADESTKRLAAQARERGASGTGFDDLARIYQNQQTRATAELTALPKPSALDQMQADLAAQQRARGKAPSPMAVAAEGRVNEYKTQRDRLSQEIQGYRDQLTHMLGPTMGGSGTAPPPTAGTEMQRKKWDAAAAFLKNDKSGKYKGKTPEQVLGPRP